ncbi:hypothetical protein [Rubritalea tangerina]|uniref:MacB-like periplasmic core domain-containing protein n=1 Tax=Rubritalea tangerina TaxID=430798 RepID=A0ABW4ZEE4_9BACT
MTRKKEDDSLVARILRKKPPHFWWFLVNTAAFCLAVWSWVFFLEVFGNPHLPQNYALLEKLGRHQETKAFDPLTAPSGAAHGPRTLYKKYYNLNTEDFSLLNQELKRVYVGNYKDTTYNTYIQGQYRVLNTRTLNQDDFITSGIAIQAQALVQPDAFHPPTPYLVLVEWILPNAPASAADAYQLGDVIEFNKNPHFPSIIHALRVPRPGDEPLIALTCVPLAYEDKIKAPRSKPFSITPPERLNLKGTFPIFTQNQ